MASDTLTTTTREPGQADAQREGGIRDTLESIVVAFVLAFVFRAFVVEAFVIPTGSMAPTLYGEHATHTCTMCGWEYAYGMVRDPTGRLRELQHHSVCPNCGWEDDAVRREYSPPDNGDRILVLKWPFDIGGKLLGPKRWEVTVFKDPADGDTNFIKRLVGLPNEVLELIDGDVYTAPAGKLPPDVLAKMDRIRSINYQRLEIQRDLDAGRLDAEQAAVRRSRANIELARLQQEILPPLNDCLTIQRKTANVTRAQESLWFVLYDHDYLPVRDKNVGWRPVGSELPSAWDTSQRTIRFDGLDRDSESIRLVGRPAANTYAYNVADASRDRTADIVSDRRVRCLLTALEGNGTFQLTLSKYDDTFAAVLDVGRGTAMLTKTTRSGDQTRRTVIGPKTVSLPLGQPIPVALSNVDYRVSLTIDGREILATDDQTYRPNVPLLRDRSRRAWPEPQTEIAADHLKLELRHVVVERDVYYTNTTVATEATDPRSGLDSRYAGIHNPFFAGGPGMAGWGTEGNPILLREKEYFMLGDNSPQSKDSRMWWQVGPHLLRRGEKYQIGTVPEDQLIGRAFFVYWPSGFRRAWAARIAIIPNVGRMRWIR